MSDGALRNNHIHNEAMYTLTERIIIETMTSSVGYGLGGSAIAAIGATIRSNSVLSEAMTILVGGVITGAMAGLSGFCLPDNSECTNVKLKMALRLLDLGLNIWAFLAAPKMGELVMGLDVPWGQVIIDELVGSATIAGGVIGVAATVVTGYGVYRCTQYCSSFFNSASSTSSRNNSQQQGTNAHQDLENCFYPS